MSALPASLSAKVGPFPVVGWLGIGAAGIGLGLVIRKNFGGTSSTPPAETAPTADTFTTQGAVSYQAGTVPLNGGTNVYGGSDAQPLTNLQWSRTAIAYLIAHNVDPIVADSAIRKYLEGSVEPLTAAEAAAVGIALKEVGVPPEGVPPPRVVAPEPAPTPPVTAAPTPAPSAPPVLTPEGVAWVTQAQAVIAAINAGSNDRAVYERAFGMGLKLSDPNLTPAGRDRVRFVATALGRTDVLNG